MPELGSTVTQKLPQLGRKALYGIKSAPSQFGSGENLKKPFNAIKDGADAIVNPGYVVVEQLQNIKRKIFG